MRPKAPLISAHALALVIAMTGLGMLPSVPPVAAEDGTIVGPSPRTAYTEPGETTTVTIHVHDVVALYGAEVRLAFDPDVVEVVDADGSTPGIQIEPLSELLSPDWILANSADNGAGTIQYAVTHVNPTPPVTGSGALAEITFEGIVAGTSPITVTYRKLVERTGEPITNTAANGLIAVGPTVPILSIAKQSATTARLSWTESIGADWYALYRGTTAYFDPSEPAFVTTTQLLVDDDGALGDVDANYAYVVKAVSASGYRSAASNRVGEFDFDLVAGTPGGVRRYNLVGVPLSVPAITNAGTLAGYVGSGVYNVLRHMASSQSIEFWLPGLGIGTNFPVAAGGAYYLHLDAASPSKLTLVGDVPSPGDVAFELSRPTPGASCRYNFITLPFEKAHLDTADELASDIGGVYMVLRYDAPTQGIEYRVVGLAGNNFALRAGYPYVVCLASSGPTEWP